MFVRASFLFLAVVLSSILTGCDPSLAAPHGLIDAVAAFLVAHAGAASSALGVLLVIVAKVFPNADASGVVKLIQIVVDAVAKLIVKFGGLVQKIADILSEVLKSDGFLGKQ